MLMRYCLVRWGARAVVACLLVTGCRPEQKACSGQIDRTTEAGVAICHAAEQPGKGCDMTTEQITERVKQIDRSILQSPEQIPAEAGESLFKLLSADDPDVRELALGCLHYAGGAPARQGIVESLNDDAEAVRSVACRFWPDHEDPAELPALVHQLTTNADAYVRECVALSIGRLGDAEAARPLNNQLKQETDPDAKRAIVLALVRLGDKPTRQAYLARFGDSDPSVRVEALEDFLYVRDDTCLPHIRPLLDDLLDAKNVAPAGHRYHIRVCDVAVQVLDSYFSHPFDFEVQVNKRYKPEELNKVMSVLERKGH